MELVDFDPDGEEKMIAAMLYPHTSLSEHAVLARVQAMTAEQRLGVMRSYCGERRNRRHRPGRALERTYYRFDVLSDTAVSATCSATACSPSNGSLCPHSRLRHAG